MATPAKTNEPEAPIPTAEETAQKERATKLREAYGAATTRLRETHRDEFDRLYTQEAEQRGVDYKPKPTAEQKAEQELKALLEKFPHLAATVAQPGDADLGQTGGEESAGAYPEEGPNLAAVPSFDTPPKD